MLKVAICDDSDRDASQLEHYLLSYDKFPLETKLYTNPQKLLNQRTPDIHCVFLDINMPGINGIDVAQKIRKFNPFIPIIFVTSYRDYMEQVFEVQTFDYIVKTDRTSKVNESIGSYFAFFGYRPSTFYLLIW